LDYTKICPNLKGFCGGLQWAEWNLGRPKGAIHGCAGAHENFYWPNSKGIYTFQQTYVLANDWNVSGWSFVLI
jgi:hypothetical protein